MTPFETLFGENRIRNTILNYLHAGHATSGTIRFNCPMCITRGETPDRRRRGGMAADRVAISCFNCGFKTVFRPGEALSGPLKAFLAEIGVPSIEIARLSFWAATLQQCAEATPDALDHMAIQPHFQPKALPEGARPIQDWATAHCTDPDFLAAVSYLYSRGETIAEATTYYWTPNQRYNLHQRIIIPCFDTGLMVGWIARSTTPEITPKYHKATPPRLLFNSQALSHPKRRVAILVEGAFDALAIDAVGLLGNRIDDHQAARINAANKRIIVLPDHDKDGGRLIEAALHYHWSVALPCPLSDSALRNRSWWGSTIKDAADAVRCYGQLYSLRSILASATDNRMEISLHQRNFRMLA